MSKCFSVVRLSEHMLPDLFEHMLKENFQMKSELITAAAWQSLKIDSSVNRQNTLLYNLLSDFNHIYLCVCMHLALYNIFQRLAGN